MPEMGTSGLMSGDGKRGGASASVLAPILDSTHFLLAARDKAASTSLRLVAVLDVLFKYASARRPGASGASATRPSHAPRDETVREMRARVGLDGPALFTRFRDEGALEGFPLPVGDFFYPISVFFHAFLYTATKGLGF